MEERAYSLPLGRSTGNPVCARYPRSGFLSVRFGRRILLGMTETRTLCILVLSLAGMGFVPASQPSSDLEYWLRRAQPALTAPSPTQPAPVQPRSNVAQRDALPGVVELSDGRQLAGELHTTPSRPWIVWVEEQKRWRRIPPAAVLSISAMVVDEERKLRWRWKATGQPEKVYTGKSYPFRRLLWRFHLADDSTLTGTVKGQPIRVETPSASFGPFLLQERSKGRDGQTLQDLVYVRKIVVSRKMMDQVLAAQASGR